METNKLGSQAVMIGSILGGNILGTIATSKVKFLHPFCYRNSFSRKG